METNKLIAEFMGVNIHTDNAGVNYRTVGERGFEAYKPFLYDTSWNELMPVIEKISRIKFTDFETTKDTAYPRTFGMMNDEGNFMFRFNRYPLFQDKTLIEAAYKSAVNFIEQQF